MSSLSRRGARIVVCTIFNLLFEYSLRGVGGFSRLPLLLPLLFGVYFAYFCMLDDLIQRFRLHNYELLLVAFFYGVWIDTLVTGVVFSGRLQFGINLGALFFVGILWWGIIQGILTFYLAGRFVPRDWHTRPTRWPGWALALGYTALFVILATHNRLLHHGTPGAYGTLSVIGLVTLLITIASLRRPRPAPRAFRASAMLDLLAGGSVLVFLVVGSWPALPLAIASGAYVRPAATPMIVIWTFLCVCGYLVYRWRSKREVTL